MEDKEEAAIIIDNGSSYIQAGLAKQEMPKSVFPTLLGRSLGESNKFEKEYKEIYFGEQALSQCNHLQLTRPIEQGIINSWDDMEKIWSYCFENQLKIDPQERTIMLTEAPFNPKQNREITTQIMFQAFSVPSFYLVLQQSLSLYTTGRTNGTVLDSGQGVSFSVPIHEGYPLPHAITQVQMGGHNITNELLKLFNESGFQFRGEQSDLEILRRIKEDHCYVPIDYQSELKKFYEEDQLHQRTHVLPDGQTCVIGAERIKAPEFLFKAKKSDYLPIPEIVYSSIMKCNQEIRRELYENIVVTGGNTMLQGFPERVGREVTWLAPSSVQVKIVAPPERKFSVWLGGSILSSLSTFQSMWVSKAEYSESGPQIVHRKCFI